MTTKSCTRTAPVPNVANCRARVFALLILACAELFAGAQLAAAAAAPPPQNLGLPPLPLPPPPPLPLPPPPPPPLPPVPPLPPIPPLPLPIPLPLHLPALSLGPPELPIIKSLPQVFPSNAPRTSGSTQLPNTSAGIDAKLLVLAGDGTEPVLGAIRQALQYEGIPYTLYIASKTPGAFTPAMLSDGNNHAYYQGIVLTTGTLAYFNGSVWSSAFNTTEWQALWDFEAKFKIRSAIGYAFPTADLGYGTPTGVDATTTPISARFTASGQAVFPYINTSNPLVITKAWTYLAAPAGPGLNVLMSDAQGNALSLVKTYPDGRQVLSMTFDGNFFLVHSLALGHGFLNWVTGGLFLGERHVYMTPQVDDIFIDDDVYGGGTYRLNAADWAATESWQTQKELQSQTAGLRLHMAFNGEGTTGTYPNDTLTPTAAATNPVFPWINHTYSHENLDSCTYDLAYNQIAQNNQRASALGFQNYDRRALVTPDVSGLVNPRAMQAAFDAGVRFLVTDTSRPGYDNPTPQAGIYNKSQPAILMIPRRPVNLYYNVTTPGEWTREYNSFYHTYWGRDLTVAEIEDKESDVLLQYMLRGEVDPWMFHQSNLRAYDGVHTLLGDLLDRTLDKYSRLYNLPVLSPGMVSLGQWTKERMKYDAAGVRCTFVPSSRTVTITASSAAVVPVTGLCTGSCESYGGQPISHVTLSPGQTVTYQMTGANGFDSPTADVAGEPDASASLHASVSPNPLQREATLSFRTTRAGFANVHVYDVAGHLVGDVLAQSDLPAGIHVLPLNMWHVRSGSELRVGTYFYRIEAAEGSATGRFIVLR